MLGTIGGGLWPMSGQMVIVQHARMPGPPSDMSNFTGFSLLYNCDIAEFFPE